MFFFAVDDLPIVDKIDNVCIVTDAYDNKENIHNLDLNMVI
jgi:hypothetical protein